MAPLNQNLPAPASDADTSGTPNVLPTPPAAQPRRSPSALNQQQLREVNQVKVLCLAARDAEHASILGDKEITAPFLTALEDDIKLVQDRATTAQVFTSKGEAATATETTATTTLVNDLRTVQASARQKYFHSNPAKLKDYLIGERIDASEPMLDQSAHTIISLANAERPPGVNTDVIIRLEGERAAITQAGATQSAEQGHARTERQLRDDLVKSIKQRGQQIQFAADGAWPPHVPASAGPRKRFKLPATRPIVG